MSFKDQLSQLVYSTDQGRIEPEDIAEDIPDSDGFVKMRRETKGRKGKGVTCLSGFGLEESELKSLCKEMKKHCGVGGSVKDYVIEIQGDQRDKLEAWLKQRDYKTKRIGG
ncbi:MULTISPECIES: translation initiation factor [unclassified Agarivorans]|uniref:translation initiation factor n=1 Tax=unclassified Agarivorans TaxID=2636026 RepID=UPI0010EA3EC6|nr:MULTISPECIES: stress response translation initiation inhibitor YciH [unclassified Agarivorans]MDO6684923.1 stress response translation initiation inhibitor YciH [Agarivorans sp. 3_MG-2023]MDO6714916.1 stress response translation initiation inhibitor YciH [Agarivorans sp. 2_MG-2023]GDY27566.1 translation initiation factor [Agarivorans sp. Toyoura001]